MKRIKILLYISIVSLLSACTSYVYKNTYEKNILVWRGLIHEYTLPVNGFLYVSKDGKRSCTVYFTRPSRHKARFVLATEVEMKYKIPMEYEVYVIDSVQGFTKTHLLFADTCRSTASHLDKGMSATQAGSFTNFIIEALNSGADGPYAFIVALQKQRIL